MTNGPSRQHSSHPEWHGRPFYGYDSPAVQEHYVGRSAWPAAEFFMPHLEPGMSLLDCGCGPASITVGLAEVVAPGRAVGIDIEPSMIAQATTLAKNQGVNNLRFEVADITDLPYPGDSFDRVFSCAVLEHLPDPVKALKEMNRVLKPGGLAGLIKTDWGDPLISPESDAVTRFFRLFERGFNQQGGSLNRGRHLRLIMQEAGFDVIEFFAAYGNATTPELVQAEINGYIAWMDNLPWFDQAIELNVVDQAAMNDIKDGMKQWSELPEAFIAKGRCVAIGRK